MFQLKNIRKSETNDFFAPIYHNQSIGTLFGSEIYIIRFINTMVTLSIAVISNDEIAFSTLEVTP